MPASNLVEQPSPTLLFKRFQKSWGTIREETWEFCRLCRQTDVEHGRSVLRNLLHDACGIDGAGRVSKLVALGALLENAELAERWKAIPISNASVVIVTARSDAQFALRLCEEKGSKRSIRQALSGSQKPNTDEWRQLSLNLPLEVYDLYRQAQNMVRFLAGRDAPEDVRLLELMFAEIINSQLPPEAEEWRAQILEGEVRCRRCGSFDSTKLDRHHVLPRSHGGHDGPIVLLCRPCHDYVQPRWRQFAEEWGFTSEATAP